jgi:hypothetical protein
VYALQSTPSLAIRIQGDEDTNSPAISLTALILKFDKWKNIAYQSVPYCFSIFID